MNGTVHVVDGVLVPPGLDLVPGGNGPPPRPSPPPPGSEIAAWAQVVFDELNDYWSTTMPVVYGIDFVRLGGGLLTGPIATPTPCGLGDGPFYCGLPDEAPQSLGLGDDYVFVDTDGVTPAIVEAYGDVALAVIMSHEFGHAIQNRTRDVRAGNPRYTGIDSELQADCWAGAFLAHLAGGKSVLATLTSEQLTTASIVTFEVRDDTPPEVSPNPHGTGFDRVAALIDGLERGPQFCAAYDVLGAFEVPTPPGPDAAGVNLPLDQSVDLALAALDEYWTAAGYPRLGADVYVAAAGERPGCPEPVDAALGYCAATDTVVLESGFATSVFEGAFESAVRSGDLLRSGDYAVVTLIAREYALGLLTESGLDPASSALRLSADCMAGLFSAAINAGDSSVVRLSFGDLDEALIGLALAPEITDATLLNRWQAFEEGFFAAGGVDQCLALTLV